MDKKTAKRIVWYQAILTTLYQFYMIDTPPLYVLATADEAARFYYKIIELDEEDVGELAQTADIFKDKILNRNMLSRTISSTELTLICERLNWIELVWGKEKHFYTTDTNNLYLDKIYEERRLLPMPNWNNVDPLSEEFDKFVPYCKQRMYQNSSRIDHSRFWEKREIVKY
jgi:hypothetical protein